MKKRLSLIFMLTALVLGAAAQDIEENVEIKVNDSEPVSVETDMCRISLRANRYDNGIELSAILENNKEEYCLLLFGRSIREKDLKRQKIRFDKKSYGKTDRKIVTCDGIEDDILEIGIGKERRLEVRHVSDDNCKLNIVLYLAKQKKRKRIIMRRSQVVLHVTIKDVEKPDGDYAEINDRCDKLIEEINHATICPGRSHGLSMEEQKNPYLEKIGEIKDEIERIKVKNGWRFNDKEYERYKELISRLDAIDFHEELCQKCKRSNHEGRHEGTSHICQYCNSTPESILQQLVSIYQQLDTRKITKDEAKSQARQVYKATKCPNFKQKMRNGGSTGTKINRYYESINSY